MNNIDEFIQRTENYIKRVKTGRKTYTPYSSSAIVLSLDESRFIRQALEKFRNERNAKSQSVVIPTPEISVPDSPVENKVNPTLFTLNSDREPRQRTPVKRNPTPSPNPSPHVTLNASPIKVASTPYLFYEFSGIARTEIVNSIKRAYPRLITTKIDNSLGNTILGVRTKGSIYLMYIPLSTNPLEQSYLLHPIEVFSKDTMSIPTYIPTWKYDILVNKYTTYELK